ncbi:sensor histidine kinase [Ramlibacter rhizophilus]|uniref:histidine kinase n=1 Tax=Ramlibacter rhizophilus TaxID=1781167 RepID=A0A4Z0C1A7_9BURK|nr:PAS domain-containing sensor histidine kinase [Ramlibacter rhizophilus]TFZ04308.1 PAS domain-containing sensor histidine kinase [Ramlibacter rhizophilus]
MPSPLLTASPSSRQLAWATLLTALPLLGVALWTQSRLGEQLLPHAFCISASQPLLKLHLVSDGLIALAYLLIPWAMLRFVRRRADVPFGWIAWVFGAFIVACGVTHMMGMWTLYYPVYWYAGVAKAFTAAISLATAWLIYRLTPIALALPSARQLQQANQALQEEVLRRRQAEAELVRAQQDLERVLREVSVEARQSAAVLDSFFEQAPLGLALLDARLRVTRVNARLSAHSGRPASEYLSAASVEELRNTPPVLVHAARRVRDTGEPCTGLEVTIQARDVPRDVKCSIFPIRADASAQPLLGVVLEDISAERALEAERAAALAAAREADQRKTEFLAVLAHELRNPLAPLRTAAAVLEQASSRGDGRSARMVAIIERQVAHMSRLVDDLLDVSRIERGTFEMQPTDCDLAGIVRQVAHDYEHSLAAVGTTLRLDAPAPLPVHGDAVRLAQAVGNYLHNAVKFAPGSEVTVQAWRDDAQGEAVVRVIDRGEGIAAELLPRLFQAFVQGSAQESRGGLGLGLSLARRLVEMHGGRVSASSAGVGQGATFELRVPLKRDA